MLDPDRGPDGTRVIVRRELAQPQDEHDLNDCGKKTDHCPPGHRIG